MKRKVLFSLLAAGCAAAFTPAQAGTPVSSPADKKVQIPQEKTTWFPDDPYLGLVTVGGIFSQHLSGVYEDSLFGIYATPERDAYFFYDSRYHYEDNSQLITSNGLAFRKLLPGRDVIVGVNAFYDAIDSQFGNQFNQFGFGAEVLTKYVDWRFNYYLPEDKQFELDRYNKRDQSFEVSPAGVAERNHLRSFKTYEAALEGFNTELGFLIPGLDKYAEVRVFGGYHHYSNPFGHDFEGFQARLEARLLPGVIADVEYTDDTYLMGGHWSAGVRVSVPFSLVALARGKNPFDGIEDQFKPGPRKFEERMGEMIIRSHRVQTVASHGIVARDTEEKIVRPAGGLGGPGGGPLPVPFE